jgi:hypothetical protein
LALALAVAAASPAQCGDGPSGGLGLSNANTPAAGAAPRSERRPPDPAVCAALCRLLEFLGSLERRQPPAPAPTS